MTFLTLFYEAEKKSTQQILTFSVGEQNTWKTENARNVTEIKI